jgi:hypothetical protein
MSFYFCEFYFKETIRKCLPNFMNEPRTECELLVDTKGQTARVRAGNGQARTRKNSSPSEHCCGRETKMGSHSNGLEPEIREVWADNLEEEMAHIRDVVEDYPYIAMVRIF